MVLSGTAAVACSWSPWSRGTSSCSTSCQPRTCSAGASATGSYAVTWRACGAGRRASKPPRRRATRRPATSSRRPRLGRLERVSARGGIRWSLPAAHPKALALTAARFPDGLPPEEVERVAGGLDVDEYGVAFG